MRRRLLFGLLIIPFLISLSLAVGVHAQQTTIQSVKLPPDTPTPWQMVFDGRYIWFAGSRMGRAGYIVRVDPSTVLTDPASAVSWWKVTLDTNPEGSWYMVTFGVDVGGGYVWSTHAYSGADDASDALIRFDPKTETWKVYWLEGVRSVRACRYDPDGYVWIAGRWWDGSKLVGALIKFDVVSETWSVVKVGKAVYDILVDGNFIWFTADSVGCFDKTSGEIKWIETSSPACMLFKAPDGSIWFSMNQAQKIGKIVEGKLIAEYDIPLGTDDEEMPYDGPYGISIDSDGRLWLAGYQARKFVVFDPVKEAIVGEEIVDNRPFYFAKTGANLLWCWGQGSVDLNRIEIQPEEEEEKPRKAPKLCGLIYWDRGASFSHSEQVVFGGFKRLEHPARRYKVHLIVENSLGEVTLDRYLTWHRSTRWAVFYLNPDRFTEGINRVILESETWRLEREVSYAAE